MAPSGSLRERYESLGGKIVDIKLPVCIRMNTLRNADILDRLKERGIKLDKVDFLPDAYYARSDFSLSGITENLLGYHYVQSAAAQLPALVLDPGQKDTVLDMCAAPGGKLTQLAALMKNKGTLIAFELKRERMLSLVTNLERCGVRNCVAFCGDASRAQKFEKFDKVLLDAPCSGNFVSDSDWFKHRSLEGIKRSAAIQRRLLRIAANCLKPGGILVYSTCSLDPLENEDNVKWALDNLSLNLEDTCLEVGEPGIDGIGRRFWPHKTKTEGFFIAKFRK